MATLKMKENLFINLKMCESEAADVLNMLKQQTPPPFTYVCRSTRSNKLNRLEN